jgi:dopamine beta-monooxygenase
VVKLPEWVRKTKHHIVKVRWFLQFASDNQFQIEADITKGNEHLVHHMEVYHCTKPTHTDHIPLYNGWCNAPNKPRETKGCSQVIGAWAMGASVSYFCLFFYDYR